MPSKSVVAAMTLACCLFTVAWAGDTWVVRANGVGPVRIGVTMAQLSAALHEKVAEEESGSESCFYVKSRRHGGMSFMIEDGHVVRIDVNERGILTSSGIQVGDTEAHARKIYGPALKVTEHKYIDNGHYLTVRSPDKRYGVRFETDGGKITGYYAGTYEAIQYVEGCE